MMLICLFATWLVVAGTASGIAFHPIRQVASNGSTNSEPTPIVTATVTTTVTEIPPTVTVAIEDSSSVANSLASAASVDTLQVSQESQLAPVSDLPFETTPTFVHSIVVPYYEATEVSGTGTGVYYVSVGPNTTDWSYTPTGHITVGLTTVTVQPVATNSSSSQITTTILRTSQVTATVHSSFSSPLSGWNTTSLNSSLVFGATGSAYSTGISSAIDTCLETSTISTYDIPTITSNAFPSGTDSPFLPHKVNGVPNFGIRPFHKSPDNLLQNLAPRQTCTQISAQINGEWVTWCNNWDGSTTLPYTIWETTVTPGVPDEITPPVTSLTSTTTSTSTVSLTSPTPTLCGESGPFVIDFDGLPQFSPQDNDTADFPPIFNPFEHFFWGDGWAYVPPPTEPFPPQNGTHLAEFVPSLANTDTGSPDAGLIPNSSFGAGPRNYNDNYWFNPSSAWVGCDNGATNRSIECDFVATGYQWDAVTRQEKVVTTQHFPQPPCPNYKNCQLRQILFSSQFTALTTLSFYANVQGDLRIFWIDSLEMDWYNNTCAAGLARSSSRKA